MAALISEFEGLGYSVTPHKVMATDYLVPQLRRRLFLLGTRGIQPEPPDPDDFARARYGIRRKELDLSARAAIGDLGLPVKGGQRASYLTKPSRFAALLRDSLQLEVRGHITRCPECRKPTDDWSPTYRLVGTIATSRTRSQRLGSSVSSKPAAGPRHMAGYIRTGQPSRLTRTFGGPTLDATSTTSNPGLSPQGEAMRFQAMPDAWGAQLLQSRISGTP